jgi:hypothetical protein
MDSALEGTRLPLTNASRAFGDPDSAPSRSGWSASKCYREAERPYRAEATARAPGATLRAEGPAELVA